MRSARGVMNALIAHGYALPATKLCRRRWRDRRPLAWLITCSHGFSRWHGSRECHCVIERSVPDRDGACAMTILPHSMLGFTRPARWWIAFARYAVSVTAIVADIVVIVGISLLMGFVYHKAAYGDIEPLQSFIGVGATAAG